MYKIQKSLNLYKSSKIYINGILNAYFYLYSELISVADFI